MEKEKYNTINLSGVSDDETDNEFEIGEEQLLLEENEKDIMDNNGFYSNAAICVPSWSIANDETIRDLEGKAIAIAVEGESILKSLFGGNQYSNVVDVKSKYKKPHMEDQWVVEKVLAKRIVMESGLKKTQYFLKWTGWAYNQSTWEYHCEENAIDDLIEKFNWRQQSKEIIRRRVPPCERIYYNLICGSFVKCHEWEDEMNKLIKKFKYKQAPIYVENWIDSEVQPREFNFILENKFSIATEQSFEGIDKIQHCNCNTEGQICGPVKNCCPNIFDQNYCYLEDGTANPRVVYKEWIVECTDACGCDLSCPTRVVQRGRQFPVVIFRTLDRGWSVRTCVSIKRHSFVCEYIGEVLTVDEALESGKSSIYQFQMDAGSSEFKFIVDAANMGNEARFINHSCNPNLAVRRVFVDRLDQNYFRIAFFAKRDIGTGDELTIDYQAMDKYAKGRRQEICRCRSKSCKGVFYY